MSLPTQSDCVCGMGRHYKIFIELQSSAIHCYHKPQNYCFLFFFFSLSSTSNSSLRPFNDQFRYLVIFFGPQHPLCPQPDIFFHCYEECLYKRLFNVFLQSYFVALLAIPLDLLIKITTTNIFCFNFSWLTFYLLVCTLDLFSYYNILSPHQLQTSKIFCLSKNFSKCILERQNILCFYDYFMYYRICHKLPFLKGGKIFLQGPIVLPAQMKK